MINYLVWLLVIILYTPIFYILYTSGWRKVDYTHAYFILPVFLWLIWRKRVQLKDSLQEGIERHNTFNLFIFFLGILMFIFGWQQDYLFISTLSLILVLYGLIGFLYGGKIVKALSFPIFYLFFLVPPPVAIIDSITLPMRRGISIITEIILRFFDYPITREGLLLTIGYQEVFMGVPCSGLRSLVTISSLVLVYVYISKVTLVKKLILTVLLIPFALLGNLIRVIVLCLITFYFGEEIGQGFFHNFSGIVIFIITILGIIWIESLLNKFSPERGV